MRFVVFLLLLWLPCHALENKIHFSEDQDYLYIHSNGIPEHKTGHFPNRNNPHALEEQSHSFRISKYPKERHRPLPLGLHHFGVALNGIPFDPGAAEFWNGDRRSGWQYEAIGGELDLGVDQHQAHVQPTGAYHYHGISPSFLKERQEGEHSPLIGYAADGFPIYCLYAYEQAEDPTSAVVEMQSSYQLKEGVRPHGPGGYYDGTFVQDYHYVEGSGHLDQCNGRYGVTPDYPEGTYYYVLTQSFPIIPRFVKGTIDPSFLRQAKPFKTKKVKRYSHRRHPHRH